MFSYRALNVSIVTWSLLDVVLFFVALYAFIYQMALFHVPRLNRCDLLLCSLPRSSL